MSDRTTSPLTTSRLTTSPVWAALLGGVLLLAVAACGSSDDGDAPAQAASPGSPAPAATRAPPASPSADAAEHPLASGWEPVALDGAEGAGAVRVLAAGPTRALAIAHTADGCCDGRVSAWVAGDQGWAAAGDDGLAALDAPGPGSSFVAAADATADGLVAVGARPAGTADSRPVPAAWTSTDGVRWVAASVPDDPATGGGTLGAVRRTADGLVAFGSSGPEGPPRLLRSADGTAWQAEPLPAGLEDATAVRFNDDAGIAWGATAGPDGSPVPALWRAGDGGWQHSNAAHLADQIVRVVPFAGGYAALGYRFEGIGHGTTATFAVVYLSDDGADWEHVLRVGEVRDMVASEAHGLVLAGVTSDGAPVLWLSADGREWAPGGEGAFESGGEPATLHSVAELPDGSLVVGGAVGASDSTSGDAALWVWSR